MKVNCINLLALATSASAISDQLVKNYCQEGKYLTLSVNATENKIGPFILPSGEAYISNITGIGNTAIVSNDPNIFTSEVAKLVLGTSTDNGILYWYVMLEPLLMFSALTLDLTGASTMLAATRWRVKSSTSYQKVRSRMCARMQPASKFIWNLVTLSCADLSPSPLQRWGGACLR